MPPFRAQVGQLSPIGILPRFRGVAEWGRIVEGRYFTDPTGRRAAKAVVDWACGALSVVVAIALSEGTAWFGVSATIYLALAVGCFVVVAEALVGFVADDPAKIGAFLNALPVLGRLSDVLAVAERHRVTEVVVAMPSSDPAVVRSLVRRVEDSGIRARAVRGVARFVMGQDPNRPGAATLHELLDSAGLKGTYPQDDHGTRRVLITGGAGYVGAHLTRMLLDRGYHVRILDRFDYGRAGIAGLHHPRLEIVRGDICNSRDLGQAVRGVEAVAALAAIVGDPACNLDPEETINLNYTATKILIDACNLYGVRRLVFASS